MINTTDTHTQTFICLMPRAYPRVEYLKSASLRNAPALIANIRLYCKGMPGKNALAFDKLEEITAIKSVITLGPGRRTIYTRRIIYRIEPGGQCNKHFYTCNLRCGLISFRGHYVQCATVQSVKEDKNIFFFRESTPFRETATTAVFLKLDEVKGLSYKLQP